MACGIGTWLVPNILNSDPYDDPNSSAGKARLEERCTAYRSMAETMSGGRIWATEGKISKGFGGCCDQPVVPVPCRKSRLAKTPGISGHMDHYLGCSVLD